MSDKLPLSAIPNVFNQILAERRNFFFARFNGLYIYDLTEDDYNKLTASRITADLQLIRDKLKEIQRDVENFIKELNPFSFKEFENDFIKYNSFLKYRTFKQKCLPFAPDKFDFTPFLKTGTLLGELL